MGITSAVAVGTLHILMTSFDPFGGSSLNNSQAIVESLTRQASSIGQNIIINTCNLPVVYDQSASTAMECVTRYKPDVVISFGEADCVLRIETAATNLDKTPDLADNAGQLRNGSVIVPNGPNRTGFSFPVQAMYCSLNSASPPVEVSVTADAFVCNNTAYHLSEDLKAQNIPFTFIHVPNSRCSVGQADPDINARAVAQMLRGAIANLRNQESLFATQAMPTTRDEASALLQTLQNQNAPACEIDFAQKVISAYDAL
jgi:pyroglutamyl-peptidase